MLGSRHDTIKFDKCFNLPNPGLTAYFANTERGNDIVYTTPWISRGNAKLTNDEKISKMQQYFDEWIPHLDKLKKTYPSLYEYEMEMAAKSGPLSVQKPLKDRIQDIDHYYDDINLKAVPVNDLAIAAALDKFKAAKGTLLRSEQKTWDNMTKSTNSGSPYFNSKRSRVIGDRKSVV